jgi:hypothetical protein
MFMGQTPSSSSYSSARVFVDKIIDLGGGGNLGDSNSRRLFDIRIGFVENPAAWQAAKAPDTTDQDLFAAGTYGSDSIHLNFKLGATDGATPITPVVNGGNLVNPTNNHFAITKTLMGRTASTDNVKESGIYRWLSTGNLSNKHNNNFIRGEPLVEDLSQPGLAITMDAENGQTYDTGVGYNDNVGLDWSMELNDPGNIDPVVAREVKFTVQVGSVTYSQVFDPGAAGVGNEVIPSEHSTTTFADGFFDWQNAYPMFYVGASGGGGLNQTLEMGFTVEGDADIDGDVDGADFLHLQRTNPGGIPAWQAAYPSPLAAASAVSAVPEPSTAVLLLAGCCGLMARRRKS